MVDRAGNHCCDHCGRRIADMAKAIGYYFANLGRRLLFCGALCASLFGHGVESAVVLPEHHDNEPALIWADSLHASNAAAGATLSTNATGMATDTAGAVWLTDELRAKLTREWLLHHPADPGA